MASYSVNERGVERARRLIHARLYVLDSEWGAVQPRAADENAFLESHSWDEYSSWHIGLTDGANDETKARYAFVYGDFRRIHRMGLIACPRSPAAARREERLSGAGGVPKAAQAAEPLRTPPQAGPRRGATWSQKSSAWTRVV